MLILSSLISMFRCCVLITLLLLGFAKPPLIGETRKLPINQRMSESPSPVAMEEGTQIKSDRFNDAHVPETLSNESSPLDVVNTSNPSSPLNGVREERFLTAGPPT